LLIALFSSLLPHLSLTAPYSSLLTSLCSLLSLLSLLTALLSSLLIHCSLSSYHALLPHHFVSQGAFEREEESLNADLSTTEDAIASQLSGELKGKKDDLETSISAVQAEIRELEEKLIARRADEAKLTKELHTVDTRIADVRKKYDRQLHRLHDRRSALDQTRSECLQECRVLDDETALFESEAEAKRKENSTLLQWSNTIQWEVAVAAELVASIEASARDSADNLLQLLSSAFVPTTSTSNSNAADSKANSDGNGESNSDSDNDTESLDYEQLHSSVAAAELELSTARVEETRLNDRMDSLWARLKEISEQLPALEVC
jgi:septal ring factor EnvC (AmiA/AmiB activator)